jgi:hypothetical protein
VVAVFDVDEGGDGFHVFSLGIDRLVGIRMTSAFAEGLERAIAMVKRYHSQKSRIFMRLKEGTLENLG